MSTMEKIFHTFNTGRHYTDKGQQIIMSTEKIGGDQFGDQYKLVFHDISRGISGVFDNVWDGGETALMKFYDGDTQASHPSREDLLDLQEHFEDELKLFSRFDNWKLTY